MTEVTITTEMQPPEPELTELVAMRRLGTQLAAAQELSQVGSWEWDIAANVVTWSDQLHRIWGTDPGCTITFESYLAGLHQDDRERARAIIEKSFQERTSFEFEHRIIRTDGTVRRVLSRGELTCDERGSPVAMRGTAQDLTDQAERMAARFRFLAEASELLASSLDYSETLRTVAKLAVPQFADWAAVDMLEPGGRIARLAVEHTDPARVRLVQELAERYPSAPDATHGVRHVLRTARPDLVEEIPAALLDAVAVDAKHRALLATLGLRSYAVLPLCVDGEAIGALTFAQAESARRFSADDLPFLEDLARRAATAIHNARLVTQLAEAHAQVAAQADELEMQAAELEESMVELEQQNDELQLLHEEANEARAAAERANETKSQFLASMSHELRTPLNAIAGYSELLELGIPGSINDEQREIIARIQRNQRRLLGLINDILNFTKLSTGRLEFPLDAVPLAVLIVDLEHALAPQVRAKQLTLVCVPPAADASAHANAERVEQILLNLLSNAVKYTPEGGAIRVDCTAGDDCVRIHVRDTGRGIPPHQLAAIFEPFVQIDPEPARDNAGVGLGLAIARELARAMAGDIEVESEPGRGSCFTLVLPVASAAGQPRVAVVE